MVSVRTGAGRPTREQSEARLGELLDGALDHFLDKGYDQATIEAIAANLGMTKRTVYARFADKAALFAAAVDRAIVRYTVNEDQIRATLCDDLEQTLINIAMLRIDLVASPEGINLQRVIQTESYRFPHIFMEMYERAALPSVRFLAEVLDRETNAGRLAIEDPLLAANTFMSMVVGGPVRFILSAIPLPREDLDARVRYGVRLFLDGALKR